jgi:hypothetical protein
MALTEEEIGYARKAIDEINAACREHGLEDDVFKLVEKEIDGKIQYFFEFCLPEFGIKKLTPLQPTDKME